MSAVGLQPWPFLFSSISAGAPERGAFFGAIKIEQKCKFCSIESGLRAHLCRMGVPAVACASRIPCVAPVQSLRVLY